MWKGGWAVGVLSLAPLCVSTRPLPSRLRMCVCCLCVLCVCVWQGAAYTELPRKVSPYNPLRWVTPVLFAIMSQRVNRGAISMVSKWAGDTADRRNEHLKYHLWGVGAGLVCHRRGPQTGRVLWTQLLEPRQYWQSLVGDGMQALVIVRTIKIQKTGSLESLGSLMLM
jgi:hypothetical protein